MTTWETLGGGGAQRETEKQNIEELRQTLFKITYQTRKWGIIRKMIVVR